MTRAEKSLIAERTRLLEKRARLILQIEDVEASIRARDNALAALKDGEPKK